MPLNRLASDGRRTSMRTLKSAGLPGFTAHRPSALHTPSFSYAFAVPATKYSASVNALEARLAAGSAPNA